MKNNSRETDFKLVIFGGKERKAKTIRELGLNSFFNSISHCQIKIFAILL